MTRDRHYWQLLLFVAVLILPTALVAVLGWRVVALDRANRVDEARANAWAEVRRDVRSRLEEIKRHATLDGWPADPALTFVAWADGETLVLPWETDPNALRSRRASEEEEFALSLEDGELLELDDRLDQAASLYRDLIQRSDNELHRAYTRRSRAS